MHTGSASCELSDADNSTEGDLTKGKQAGAKLAQANQEAKRQLADRDHAEA
jgi:hypothetical protein